MVPYIPSPLSHPTAAAITDGFRRCAGAGTAADTEFTTSITSSNLALHGLSTGRTPRVITAVTHLKQYLFKYGGHIGAYLIVAGVDPTGIHLCSVHSHGSTDKLPYMTLGSGSLAAMGVLESEFKHDMEKEAAMDLVCRAVLAGVWNDLGSGGKVDLVVMEMDQVVSTG
jgi:20S proteasome subunit beta 2